MTGVGVALSVRVLGARGHPLTFLLELILRDKGPAPLSSPTYTATRATEGDPGAHAETGPGVGSTIKDPRPSKAGHMGHDSK